MKHLSQEVEIYHQMVVLMEEVKFLIIRAIRAIELIKMSPQIHYFNSRWKNIMLE